MPDGAEGNKPKKPGGKNYESGGERPADEIRETLSKLTVWFMKKKLNVKTWSKKTG